MNFNNMRTWEQRKALFLADCMIDLGFDYDDCEVGVNPNSGYTFIYLEDEAFTLYMPINAKLTNSYVWVQTLNPITEEEEEITLDDLMIDNIYEWIDSFNKEEN